MEIKSIELVHFRNYEQVKVPFHRGINIFVGSNGQGKTNLLEAIALLSGNGSHRDAKDTDMLSWQKDFYRIKAEGLTFNHPFQIDLLYSGEKRKKVQLNGRTLKRIYDLSEAVNTVIFSPEDLALVKGSPSERRRFLDREIGQTSPAYCDVLQRYQKAITQRNALLRRIRQKEATMAELDLWDEQVAPLAVELLQRRLDSIAKIAPYARQIYNSLSEGKEELDLTYRSSFPLQYDRNYWLDDYKKALRDRRSEEIIRQVTLVGPHRDDLQLYINKREAKLYASQGQQRSIALSLKLAEIAFIYYFRKEYPIVLLDDVMSELDPQRREQLLKDLHRRQVQVFITTTHLRAFPATMMKEMALFRVQEGRLWPTSE
ncbi:DNA replication/repair protein RecF [Heliorestis acidaminivorans]|uniref:DNA replication/repair protein RecF n=1 Tax=Heliorestis acidaminivorans TaxID=553427 RepID=UPI001478BAAA|nr:DNA replication/repair protein RecF [Heliorestis acidaminivorans]